MAVLEQSPGVIEAKHLRQALAIWHYCFKSATFIFGGSTGNEEADAILRALRGHLDDGFEPRLSRTYITVDVFHKNVKRTQIDAAIQLLEDTGAIRRLKKQEEGAKKPTEYVELVTE